MGGRSLALNIIFRQQPRRRSSVSGATSVKAERGNHAHAFLESKRVVWAHLQRSWTLSRLVLVVPSKRHALTLTQSPTEKVVARGE